MCRFTLYMGPSIPLRGFLFESEHGLVEQSVHSTERDEPLNGDGFGIGWYAPEQSAEPAVFRSITPAWNNRNLLSLSKVVSSGCVLAHVRAATSSSGVNESNCHPFRHGATLFAHNGDIAGFRGLRRALLDSVCDLAFDNVYGSTDSEHFFALVIDELEQAGSLQGAQRLAAALNRALWRVVDLVERHSGGEPCYLNMALTDGDHVAAARFSTDSESGPESLYYFHGRSPASAMGRTLEDGLTEPVLFVSSERLSGDPAWQEVPANHMVVATRGSAPALVRCLRDAHATRAVA